jgi:hypothetical protein
MASIDYPRTDARSVEEVEEAGRPPPLLPPSSPPPWPQQLQRQQRRPRQQRLQTARRRAAPCPVAISSAMSFPSRSSKSRSRRSHSTSVPTEHRMWHTSSLVGSAAAGATPSIVAASAPRHAIRYAAMNFILDAVGCDCDSLQSQDAVANGGVVGPSWRARAGCSVPGWFAAGKLGGYDPHVHSFLGSDRATKADDEPLQYL